MRNTSCRTRTTIAAICGLAVLSTHGVSGSALPPDPDNAALVYYRAYLLDPGPERPWSASLSKFMASDGPLDEKVRFDLRARQPKIELIETASKMPRCDWGIQYSRGFYQSNHFPMMTGFANLLGADAQRLAIQGQYRAALERCLTIRRLAPHIGDETSFACAIARNLNLRAEISTQRVLGIMPPDADTLLWLKSQLSEEPSLSLPLDRVLKMDFDLALEHFRKDARILAAIRQELAERASNESDKRQITSLTDEELLVRARDAYAPFLSTAIEVMHSGKSYRETYGRLKELREELEKEYGSDPAARQIITACADDVPGSYKSQVFFATRSNALGAAIEVYLDIAKTGRVRMA
jgi:hypothetical protein